MDLAAIAKQATAVAFDIAGTAKTTAILNVGATGTYDPVTDTTTPADGSQLTVLGVLYKSKQSQNAETGINADFVIEGADIPESGIDEADTVIIDGTVWNIYEVQAVPTKAITILSLRR
jgi:hypothetical protein